VVAGSDHKYIMQPTSEKELVPLIWYDSAIDTAASQTVSMPHSPFPFAWPYPLLHACIAPDPDYWLHQTTHSSYLEPQVVDMLCQRLNQLGCTALLV
jgi:hypothetical protein